MMKLTTNYVHSESGQVANNQMNNVKKRKEGEISVVYGHHSGRMRAESCNKMNNKR
jgi:hypothetical protein